MPVPLLPFPSLTPLERHIDARLRAAPAAGPETRDAFSVTVPDGVAPYLTGQFLRWLLLEAVPGYAAVTQVLLHGVTVITDVDLAGVQTGLQLRFVDCHFTGRIDLNDASVGGLALISGRAWRIDADRLNTTGSVEIRHPAENEPRTGKFTYDAFTIGYWLRLCGAEIRGNLDMRGCVLEGLTGNDPRVPLFADGLTVKSNILLSDGFRADGEIRLNGAQISRNLDCSGGTISNPRGYTLAAAGAKVDGTVYLCRTPSWTTYQRRFPFTSTGTVRLEGATIQGDLDCSGSRFIAGPFLTPNVRPPAEERERLYAINAEGINVGATVKFRDTDEGDIFSVQGAIQLISAKIGGDLNCMGARFDFPGEELLVADGMVVDGTTFFKGAYVNGLLRLAHVNLKDGLYLDQMEFDTMPPCRDWFGDDNVSRRELGPNARGVYARQATVGGNFRWESNRKILSRRPAPTNYWLYLEGSKTDIVRDDPDSWQRLDHFNVDGCSYSRFSNPSDYRWRVDELDRQYATLNGRPRRTALWALWNACARKKTWRWLQNEFPFLPGTYQGLANAVTAFKPQPYLQLARTFRNAGYEKTANNILVRFQRNKTRYGDLGILGQIGRWLVDIFVQYGFAPFRPLNILVCWAVVSAVVFQLAYLDGKILPIKDQPQVRPKFNTLLYAADTLVPFVDFNQKKSWTVEVIGDPTPPVRPPRSMPPPPELSVTESVGAYWQALKDVFGELPGRGAALLLVFNTFFGWLMTSFLIAGVGGLLRTGREEG
jgi:hypothetical protein